MNSVVVKVFLWVLSRELERGIRGRERKKIRSETIFGC